MATYSKLPSGRWRVQIRRGDIYRAATFEKKSDARDWSTQIEAQAEQVQKGGLINPKGLKVGHLVEMYREAIPGGGRTKGACLARLESRLKRTSPDRLAFALRDYIDKRQAEGAGGVTIAQDLSYLSTVLDWARHTRRIDVDPEVARDARRGLKHRKLNTRSNERDRTPTQAELDALFAHWAAENPWRHIPMIEVVRFALASAMRLGEITRITAEDVDEARRAVIIRQRKDPKKKELNDQLVPLVGEAWTMVQMKLDAKATGRLFPYNPRSVSAAFTRTCQKVGIADLHFHDLRHAATAQLFRMGLDIPRVAMITGHRSWENLKRYTNLQPEDVHDALRD
ncbi:MAG: site-specific integrase [Chromatiaceae bacterium]|nr:site-specific integrase [Chromatiaceae bacterium]MCP5415222.1 site-specific integrase [Chromatiaceae bacterium]